MQKRILNKSRDRKNKLQKEVLLRQKLKQNWWQLMRSLGIITGIIAGNKPEFLRTILEQCNQACLAQEGAPKDVKSYSDSHLPRN